MTQAQAGQQLDPNAAPDGNAAAEPRRMFVFERGWNVGMKTGSHRELCHMMAPGQDFYHRLGDGEVYVHQNTEKLCLSCAFRRGLIAFEPKQLRDSVAQFVEDRESIPLDVASR
jgi:hypothetical protein